jgi:hypothetical protein
VSDATDRPGVGRVLRLPHGTNVTTHELDGENAAIRQTTDPIAVLRLLGDLEAATPLSAEVTADLDRGTDREVRSRRVGRVSLHLFSHLARDRGGTESRSLSTHGSERTLAHLTMAPVSSRE